MKADTMDRQTELGLLDELIALREQQGHYLDDASHQNPATDYTDPQRFLAEQRAIFQRLPAPLVHVSELNGPNTFVQRTLAGRAVLVTRDKTDSVHAFLNVCRHRGATLVTESSGCKARFTCPYHAWTYANTGELLSAPHFDAGFDDIEPSTLGLRTLPCVERYGFIWVSIESISPEEIVDYLAAIDADLAGLALDEMVIAAQTNQSRQANWKILVEGGLEAYHFKVAHKNTIGPYFQNNLSSYQQLGVHFRSILPRNALSDLVDVTRDQWQLRNVANILYSLFPNAQLLAQQDHVVWITQEPVSHNSTQLRLITLVPKNRFEETAYWQRNHAITETTLNEDFDLGEDIQRGLDSGATERVLFGRFEGALTRFNRQVRAMLGKACITLG
jgi:phenylpropionate dioxygenase-like ring-hydroxylating dioxygenase large terminal subunit